MELLSKIMLTNIQRFSLHDGPGIRTTVFLKGCSLRCPWCCNPENIENSSQKYIHNNKENIYGLEMTTEELYKEIVKDKTYYRGNLTEYDINSEEQIDNLPGGISFSGGEPLLQINELKPLLECLNKDKIHVCIETSLYASQDKLEIALKYADLFYADMKSLDKEFCNNILKGDVRTYIRNYKTLMESHKPTIVRIPVIGGYTDSMENFRSIVEFLKNNKNGNVLRVELLKGHDLGRSKYLSLGYKPPEYINVPDELLCKFQSEIEEIGYIAKVCHV